MRVLLIQAVSTTPGGECVYPLGLARLAGALGDRRQLQALDLNLDPFPWPEVIAALEEFRPQAVCISFRNLDPLAGNLSSFVPQLKTLALLLRGHAPRAKLIIGGSGFSLFPERLLGEVPEIDLGLIGEAEQTLPHLLDSLDDPGAVPGAVFRKGNRIVCNPAGPALNLDLLPGPNYRVFPVEAYQRRNAYVAFMGVETKRGCAHQCSYCLYPVLQGSRVRLFPPRMVVDELERLQREHAVEAVHFTDPVVNQPASHLRAICGEIIRRGLSIGWTGFFREDCLSAEDLDIYQRAGLMALYFSADGASDHSLEVLNKKMTIDQIEQAARMAADSGIVSVYHFLVNLPGESRQSVDQSKRLIERILGIHDQARNPAAMVFNNLRLYPGAPLTERIIKEGLVDPLTDLLYGVYFNPPPFDALRHELNALCTRPEHLGLAAGGTMEASRCAC